MGRKNSYAQGYADGTLRAKAIVKTDIEYIMSALFIVMHEKHGWGEKRITQLNEDILNLWNYVATTEGVSMPDLLYEKTGMKVIQMKCFED